MKIKEMFSKIGTNIKQLINEYPITLIIIAITTILAVLDIYSEWHWLGINTINKIVLFAFIWSIGTFLTEISANNKKHKIIFTIVTGIISFVFVKIMFYYEDIFGIKSAIVHDNLLRVLICYVITLLLISIYKLIKKSELAFSEYTIRVFANAFVTGIMYAVLALGILLLSLIFISLILDNEYSDIIWRAQILLLGLFYIPSILYSLTQVRQKEVNNIIKNFVYVLLTLITIAIAIIYMYIIKIVIQQDMPENFIYRIIATIFVFAFPVWVMASKYRETNKFVGKLSVLLPYAFIPLIILEVYSIGIRIADYGLTPNRYVCVAFALVQTIAIILCIYKKQAKLAHICIYAIAITIIATISPLNMQYISNLNQKSILVNNLKEGTDYLNLDDDTKKRVNGAYRYIKALPDSDKYLPDYIKNDTELISKLGTYISHNRRSAYYSGTNEDIDISGYDKMKPIYIAGSGNQLSSKTNDIDITNVQNYLKQVMAQPQGTERIFIMQNQNIQINEKQKICITYVSISWYEEEQEAEYFSIQGYLLTKE